MTVPNNTINLYIIAFSIQNFINKDIALYKVFYILKPGGIFIYLKFSKVNNLLFDAVYKY